jgi:glycosyltransferase involved in cell wall biosynthesis
LKLFIFESHPVQYHAPVYRELHSICQEHGEGELKVFYATDVTLRGHFDNGFGTNFAWDEPLLHGYSASVLRTENGIPLTGFNTLTGRGIPALLKQERPDAVLLTGLAYRFDWTAYLTAIRLQIPIWLRTETQDEAFERTRLKSLMRSWFYRLTYSRIQNALSIGELNARHYLHHGIPLTRQIRSPYCVFDRFQNLSPTQSNAWRQKIRTTAGFSNHQIILLFCGKFQPKKNPEILLEALAAMPVQERARFAVLYVGSGELETALRLKARPLAGTKVHFAGFKNQTEVAPYYLASDVLVLPSRKMGETWGLVVNEALMAGRSAIISRHVGCHADFKELPAVSVFDGSRDSLIKALRNVPKNFCVVAQQEFMRRYSIRAAAAGIAAAMRIHSNKPKPKTASDFAFAETLGDQQTSDRSSGVSAFAD